MKKGNRMSAKILAFFLSCLMLFSCLSVGISAAELISGDEKLEKKNYSFVLNQTDDGKNNFVLTIDLEGINKILETRELTKEDLEAYMPEIVWNALMNRDIPGMEEFLTALKETGLLNESVLKQFIPADVVESVIAEIVDSLGDDIESVLKDGKKLTDFVTDELMTEILDNGDVISALVTEQTISTLLAREDVNVEEIAQAVDKDALISVVKANHEEWIDTSKINVSEKDAKEIIGQEKLNGIETAAGDAAKDAALAGKLDGTDTDAVKKFVTDYVSGKIDELLKTDEYQTKVIEKYVTDVNAVKGMLKPDKSLSDLLKAANISATTIVNIIRDKVNDADAILIETVGGYGKIISAVQTYASELYQKIYEAAVAEVDFAKVIEMVDMKSLAKDLVLRIDSISLDGTPIYYDVAIGKTLDMNAVKNALMTSIPTMEELETIDENEIIYDLALNVIFGHGNDQKTITYTLSIILTGDTSKVNAAADKLFNYFSYEIGEDSLSVEISDNKSILARAMAKILNYEFSNVEGDPDIYGDISAAISNEQARIRRLLVANGYGLIDELYDLRSSFTYEREIYVALLDWVEGKVTAQSDKLAAVENKIDSLLNREYIDLATKALDLTIKALERMSEVAPEKFENVTLLDLYQGNGVYSYDTGMVTVDVLEKAGAVLDRVDATDLSNEKLNALVDKLQSLMNNEAMRIVDGEITQELKLQANLPGLYQVSFYERVGDNDELLYTTIYPTGADLETLIDEEVRDCVTDRYPGKDLKIVWYEADGSEMTAETMPAKDAKYYVKVEVVEGDGPGGDDPVIPPSGGGSSTITYKVTFMADGKTVDVVLYERGQKELHYIPAVPEKEGYVGVWEDFELSNKDIVVNAIYTPADATLTATFVADGVVVAQVPFKAGDIALSEVPEVPAKRGFAGVWESYTLGVTDITINAIYTAVDPLVATFVADGVVVAEIEFYPGDTKLTGVPSVPAKTGYSGKWESYKLGTTDITINAVYTAKTYDVNFRSNGGNGTMGIQKLTYDKAEALKANTFTRSGYKFVGWNTKADGTGTSYKDGETVKNLLESGTLFLYAQWEKEGATATTYTATFKADGVTVATVTFNAGDTKLSNVPAVPAKVGYSGAWEDYKLGNANITINAIYTANTYTIVFNANGGAGTMASQTMTYDVAAALSANTLTRDGYKFAGWNTAADGSGVSYTDGQSVKNLAESGEVTLYAQWTEVSEPIDPPVDPVEPKSYTAVIVVIIVVVVIATAGVVYGAVVYTKKKMTK